MREAESDAEAEEEGLEEAGGEVGGADRGQHRLEEVHHRQVVLEVGNHRTSDDADDIGEQKNLAASQPQKAAELRARLTAWQKKMNAKMPVPNPDYKAPAVIPNNLKKK